MRTLLVFALLVVGCKKTTVAPPVDIDTMLHGTRPPSSVGMPPSFQATAHDGTARGPRDLLGQPTVLWFFPAANTSGCTVEGCGYRDHFDDFQALGVRIVGVSFTDLETNRAWVESQGFQYEIWRDDGKQLAMYYGAAAAPSDAYPKRRTRVLDANGAVVLEYNDKIVVGAHPEEVLADVRLMFAKGN
jgi:peroxiredoxin Q/BCP